MTSRFEQLVERASDAGPLRVAVLLPHTEASLRCIVQAHPNAVYNVRTDCHARATPSVSAMNTRARGYVR